jgi:hypothetical protein
MADIASQIVGVPKLCTIGPIEFLYGAGLMVPTPTVYYGYGPHERPSPLQMRINLVLVALYSPLGSVCRAVPGATRALAAYQVACNRLGRKILP